MNKKAIACFGMLTMSIAIGVHAADLPNQITPQRITLDMSRLQSNAEQIQHDTAKRIILDTKSVSGGVTQKGSPQSTPKIITGQAVKMSMSETMGVILPEGWKVSYIETDIPQIQVGWAGNTDWVSIITSIAVSNGLYCQLDWDRNIATWSKSPLVAPKETYIEPPPPPPMLIMQGEPIHEALRQWCEQAGWTFIWYPRYSWRAIAAIDMTKHGRDIVSAVSEVATILREEGHPIQLRVSRANQVMEVIGTEVVNE